jgi:hypothetical protein
MAKPPPLSPAWRLARAVALLAAAAVAAKIAGDLFASRPLGADVIAAVLLEILASNVTGPWFPEGKTWATLARLALRGALPALAAASAALALCLGWAALSLALLDQTGRLVASLGASVALIFTADTLLGALGARWASGNLTPLDRASGPGAWLLALALFMAAGAVTSRGQPPAAPGAQALSPAGHAAARRVAPGTPAARPATPLTP